jgi:acyl-ACP thioesterase
MNLVWRETYRVRFYEAEPGGRASAPAICRYLQETADIHCRAYGLSLDDLRATGRLWVLTHLSLRLTGRPRVGDEVAVETWGTRRLGGVRAYRDFLLLDAAGRTFGEASSLWLLLDAATRRPVRLPESILRFRHPDRVGADRVDAMDAIPPEHPSLEERDRVRWHDLDANGHANNVCYVDWAIETVPLALRREGRLSALDVRFVSEAFLDDEVISTAEEFPTADAPSYRHALRAGDGRLLAAGRTEWTRR